MVFPEMRQFLIATSIHGGWVVFSKTSTSHFLELFIRSLNLEDLVNSNIFPKAKYLCTKCYTMYRVKCKCSQRRVYIHMTLDRRGQVFSGFLFIATSWDQGSKKQ